MIYSASRRTDLVAFYPDFICEKVRRSRKLEGIVFWTKDPRPFQTHLGLQAILGAYPSVMQLTLTGLAGSYWEPEVPPPERFAPALAYLRDTLPPGAVQWRFDPILADETVLPRFDRCLALLRKTLGRVEAVTVSFPDPYKKVVERLQRDRQMLPTLREAEQRALLEKMHQRSGLTLHLCCEPHLLDLPFVRQARCVDSACFDRLYGTTFGAGEKDGGQRAACGCTRSTDIGSYDMVCRHNCRYCYANPAR